MNVNLDAVVHLCYGTMRGIDSVCVCVCVCARVCGCLVTAKEGEGKRYAHACVRLGSLRAKKHIHICVECT